MAFTGDLIFDASNSNFAITGIEAFTKLNSFLKSDTNQDGIVSLEPAVPGDYKFILLGNASGIYHVEIECVSAKPTVFPTESPTPYPSKRPSYAPVNHPITPHPTDPSRRPTPDPSAPPVPTDATPTVRPTDRPTDRPGATTKRPTTPPVVTTEATDTTEDSNDEGEDEDGQGTNVTLNESAELRIAVYIVLSFIISCICVLVLFLFYKYCFNDVKKMIMIEKEMYQMRTGVDSEASKVVAVKSGDWTIPQQEIEFERDLVVQWLRHTVRLPEYTETLFNEGYDNMRAIQTIDSREELARCGIARIGHQSLILAEVKALHGMQFGTKGGITHGDGGGHMLVSDATDASDVLGTLPLPPPPVMDTKGSDELQYGAKPNVNGEGLVGYGRRDSQDEIEDLFESNHVNVTHGTDEAPPTMNNPMMAPPPPPEVRVTPNGMEAVYSDPDSSSDDALTY
eukprot:58324_1